VVGFKLSLTLYYPYFLVYGWGEGGHLIYIFGCDKILIEAHIESLGKDAVTYDLLPPHIIDNMD
jgi:hypothetical protein